MATILGHLMIYGPQKHLFLSTLLAFFSTTYDSFTKASFDQKIRASQTNRLLIPNKKKSGFQTIMLKTGFKVIFYIST
jgi:hypothetical protein